MALAGKKESRTHVYHEIAISPKPTFAHSYLLISVSNLIFSHVLWYQILVALKNNSNNIQGVKISENCFAMKIYWTETIIPFLLAAGVKAPLRGLVGPPDGGEGAGNRLSVPILYAEQGLSSLQIPPAPYYFKPVVNPSVDCVRQLPSVEGDCYVNPFQCKPSGGSRRKPLTFGRQNRLTAQVT